MASVTSNSPLPPSVEAAYYRKCIQLKRRINEIEESNDAVRLRKARVERAILKLRLERTFLLEQIESRMANNVDESDDSESPPPTVRAIHTSPQHPPPPATRTRPPHSARRNCTLCHATHSLTPLKPQDKPLRSKRGHRKATPPASSAPPSQQPTPAHAHTAAARPGTPSAAAPSASGAAGAPTSPDDARPPNGDAARSVSPAAQAEGPRVNGPGAEEEAAGEDTEMGEAGGLQEEGGFEGGNRG